MENTNIKQGEEYTNETHGYARILFTRLPGFIGSGDEGMKKFFHCLEYLFSKIETTEEQLDLTLYELSDKIVGHHFMDWLKYALTDVHPETREQIITAEGYYFITDPSGTMVEYAKKLSMITPILPNPMIYLPNEEGEAFYNVKAKLSFSIVSSRSPIITLEAVNLLKKILKQSALNFNSLLEGSSEAPLLYTVSPLLFNDPRQDALNKPIFKENSYNFNPGLGDSIEKIDGE